LLDIQGIAETLKRRGFRVSIRAKIKGVSGVVHEIDLIVIDDSKYAFIFLDDCSCENFIRHFVKAIDLQDYRSFLFVSRDCAERIFTNVVPKSTIVYSGLDDLVKKILDIVSLQ